MVRPTVRLSRLALLGATVGLVGGGVWAYGNLHHNRTWDHIGAAVLMAGAVIYFTGRILMIRKSKRQR